MAEKNTKMERGLSREYLAVIFSVFLAPRTCRNCLIPLSRWFKLTRKCLLLWPGIKRIVFSEYRARCHSIRFGVPKKGAYRVCDFLIRSSPSGRHVERKPQWRVRRNRSKQRIYTFAFRRSLNEELLHLPLWRKYKPNTVL